MYFEPKKFTASGQVSSGPCLIGGLAVKGGSDLATAALADQATSGGTELLGCASPANDYRSIPMTGPARFNTACYVTITGASPAVYVLVAAMPGT